MASKNSEYFKEGLKFGDKPKPKRKPIPPGESHVDSPLMDLKFQRPKESAGKVGAKPIPPETFEWRQRFDKRRKEI